MNQPAPVKGECNALRFYAKSGWKQLEGQWVRCTLPANHESQWHQCTHAGICCAWDGDYTATLEK